MKIIYFGSAAPLSYIPLRALLSSGHKICAIALDSLHEHTPFTGEITTINATSESIESLALLNKIPLIKLNKDLSKCKIELDAYQADIILVSCYVRRLPDSILKLPRIGCFNIHPSLLPAYRGPDPVFWQFRDGVTRFGVSLHRMSPQFDCGELILQSPISLPQGINKNQAKILLAHAAVELLKQALPILQDGQSIEMAQDEGAASYQAFPTQNDYRVSVQWTARRMYNFMCAYGQPGIVFSCEVDGRVYSLLHAHSYQDDVDEEMQAKRYSIKGQQITLGCQQGMVRCQLAE